MRCLTPTVRLPDFSHFTSTRPLTDPHSAPCAYTPIRRPVSHPKAVCAARGAAGALFFLTPIYRYPCRPNHLPFTTPKVTQPVGARGGRRDFNLPSLQICNKTTWRKQITHSLVPSSPTRPISFMPPASQLQRLLTLTPVAWAGQRQCLGQTFYRCICGHCGPAAVVGKAWWPAWVKQPLRA